MRTWMVVLLIVLAAIAGGGWYWHHNDKPAASFRMAQVSRQDLLATISATGTLEPEEVVDVGSQVAGQINAFGKDPHQPGKFIDYGSEVEVGTVLAQIDDSLYQADVASAQAQVAQGKANVERAKADLGQMQAKVLQTGNDWKRAQQAGATAGLSQSDLGTYEANYQVASANLAVGEAAVTQAETGEAQADAMLKRAQRNLSYCTITSPVKGTIVDRRVNIGQTVVASLNAPSLFLIAKDLKRMQLWASVNEADIGNIHPGQPVTFTVDAFANQKFRGSVSKVRLNATMTQNIVTYTVEVATENKDGKLLPYMTANAQFELDKRTGVLTVPNAALRWMPQTPQIAPDARSQAGGNAQHESAPAAGGDTETDSQHKFLWIRDGQFVRPVSVQVGLSDGMNTEVAGDAIREGTPIITGDAEPEDAAGGTANPFVPQFSKRKS